MTIGCSNSGKSTFAKKLKEACPDIIHLERDMLRTAMTQELKPVFDMLDDKSQNTIIYNTFELLVKESFATNKSLLLANCNGLVDRREVMKKITPEAKYIMVYLDVDEDILRSRTKKAEEENKESFMKREEYQSIIEHQIQHFKPPTPDEADHFFTIQNNKNTDAVIAKIKSLITIAS